MDEMYTYPGTYVGSPTMGVTGLLTGDPNTAITGNGTTAKVTLPATGAMAAWSICFWMRALTTSADFTGIFTTTGDVMDIATFANNQLGYYDGVGWVQTGVPPFALNDTNFWVITFTAGPVLNIYKDGELAYTAARGRALTNVTGSLLVNGAAFSANTLDEFAIFNRVLTQAEITSLFTVGTSGGAATAPLVTVAQIKARLQSSADVLRAKGRGALTYRVRNRPGVTPHRSHADVEHLSICCLDCPVRTRQRAVDASARCA